MQCEPSKAPSRSTAGLCAQFSWTSQSPAAGRCGDDAAHVAAPTSPRWKRPNPMLSINVLAGCGRSLYTQVLRASILRRVRTGARKRGVRIDEEESIRNTRRDRLLRDHVLACHRRRTWFYARLLRDHVLRRPPAGAVLRECRVVDTVDRRRIRRTGYVKDPPLSRAARIAADMKGVGSRMSTTSTSGSACTRLTIDAQPATWQHCTKPAKRACMSV